MTVYRCYFLDPENHITDVEPIDQPTDELASGQAQARFGKELCHAVEVWESGRLVCRLGTPSP